MKNTFLILMFLISSCICLAQLPGWLPGNGLIAWYPFNGNANDSSGNGNHGIVIGATLTTNRFGNINSAYAFNGSSGHISIADALPLRLSNTDFTISAWVYETTLNPTYTDAIISKRIIGSQQGYMFRIIGIQKSLPGRVSFRLSQGFDPSAVSNDTITLNSWQHLVVQYTYSTQTMNIYMNGSLNSTTTGIPSPNASISALLWIGDDVAGQSYCFHGKIDDIAIYHRALQLCEIKQLFYASNVSVTTQPSNQYLHIGSAAMLITSSSDSCISYQWQQDCGTGYVNLSNAGIYSGAYNDTLIINPVSLSINNCHFRCIVSSCLSCSDTTAEANLDVTAQINELNIYPTCELFPTPFSDELTVSLKNNRSSEIIIYDITSRELLKQIFINSASLKTEQFGKGMYIYQVRNNNGLFKTGKLIKN